MATARRANLTIRDYFTIGMETGVQNAQIAITIVQFVYLGQPYIFAQQFFFPIICFVFQVSQANYSSIWTHFQFSYWVISMVVLLIYKLSTGEPLLPQKEVEAPENSTKAQTNPAFELSDNF